MNKPNKCAVILKLNWDGISCAGADPDGGTLFAHRSCK